MCIYMYTRVVDYKMTWDEDGDVCEGVVFEGGVCGVGVCRCLRGEYVKVEHEGGVCEGGVCEGGVCEGGVCEGGVCEDGMMVKRLITCTVLRWRMAQLLMAFTAAVAMVRVVCGRGRGEEECRGGPSCSSIAYNSCISPGGGVRSGSVRSVSVREW